MFYKLRYFRKTKDVKLAPREKLAIQNNLKSFMQANPVRVEVVSRQLDQETSSNFLNSFKSMMLKPLPIALSALLLVGGGTAFAAEQSLPNESLYPVKIQVNERVRAALALNAEADAKWETRVAERRLEEVEKLAIQNKLDAKTRAEIEARFDAQAKLVNEKIANLKTAGKTEAAIDASTHFQASLRAHQTILMELDAREEQSKKTILPILEKVRLNTALTTNERIDTNTETPAEITTQTDTQAEWKMMAYKQKEVSASAIANAKQDLGDSSRFSLNAQTKAKAALLLQLAQEEFQKGDDQFNQTEFKLALTHYQRAEIHAQELLILVKTSQTLRLEKLQLLPDLVAEKGVILTTDPKNIEINDSIEVKTEVKTEPYTETPPKPEEPSLRADETTKIDTDLKTDLGL